MRLFDSFVYNVESKGCLFKNISMRDIKKAIRLSDEDKISIHEALERVSYNSGDYSRSERKYMNKMILIEKIDMKEAVNRVEALRLLYGKDSDWKDNDVININKISYTKNGNNIIYW